MPAGLHRDTATAGFSLPPNRGGDGPGLMLFISHYIGPQKLLLEQQPLASNPVCGSKASVRARPPSISAALVVSHLPRTFTLPRSCFVDSSTLYGATKIVAWPTRCANSEGIASSSPGLARRGAAATVQIAATRWQSREYARFPCKIQNRPASSQRFQTRRM